MKKPFIHEDFLLQNKTAQSLFHDIAAEKPIIDYHCHLPPDEIVNDINFRNMTHIWLDGDHYNTRDNALLTTLIGNFRDGSIHGKLQSGPP